MSESSNEPKNQAETVKRIEAILFAAPGLTGVDQIVQTTGLKAKEVESALSILRTH